MLNLPTKTNEKKEASISVRARATVLDRLKQMADKHNLSQSQVIEYLVDRAFEEFVKMKRIDKKGKYNKKTK
ncbi:MAG: hypothetical protein HQK51_20000 [Oligoflexia bacterium]|nr:hypothetical protein [Oligoflexia bacterium]